MKKTAFLLVCLALAAPAFWGCKRTEPTPRDPGITESDRRKLKAYLDEMTKVTTQADLPARYHDRSVPTKESGIVFEVYQDEKLIRAVRVEDFTCPEKEQLISRKGPKSHANCPLLPFLRRLTQKPIAYLDLVGEKRDFVLGRFVPSELEREGLELAAFLAPRGQVRIEERPRESLMTPEEADALGIREGRKGGRGMGRKRGAMRGHFKTRTLYWVDLFTEAPPTKPSPGPGGPKGARAKRPARTPPSEPGRLALLMPGGEIKWVGEQEVRACGEAGCRLADVLPGNFAGRWCVIAAGSVTSLSHQQITQSVLRFRRQGGFALKLPGAEGQSVRQPTSIAPCP